MWLLHGGGERHLSTWPAGVSCVAPRQIGVMTLCVGWRAREGGAVVWRLEPASGRIPVPIALPGNPKVWGVSHDAGVFAMHDGKTLSVLDLDRRTVVRRLTSVQSGSPFALVPRSDRVVMLWDDHGARVLTVYGTR